MSHTPSRWRFVLVAFVLAAVTACQHAPVTGRSQFILIPESQDAGLGLSAYRDILSKSEISRDRELNERVRRVGRRIAAVWIRF